MNINYIMITGRVGRVYNIINAKNGSGAAVNFSIGVSSGKKNAQGNSITQWYTVKKWYQDPNMTNRLNDCLKPGLLVAVRGTLEFDPQTGGPAVFQKKDGTYAAIFAVNAIDIDFAQRATPQQQNPQNDYAAQPSRQNQQNSNRQKQMPAQSAMTQRTPNMYEVDDDRFNCSDDLFI